MNKKIIIAEDSSVIQNLIKRILLNQNYEITSAKNGAEVLKKIEKDKHDLILMDINMPVMDGVTCAKEIRANANPDIKNIPIIAITGNANNFSKDDFAEVGINDFIAKPINYDSMVEVIREKLN